MARGRAILDVNVLNLGGSMSYMNSLRRTRARVASLLLGGLAASSALAADRVAVAPGFALAPAGSAAESAPVELAALKGKKRALLVFSRSW